MIEAQKEFLEEFDKKYYRMRNFLLTIIGILLSVFAGNMYLSGKNQGKLEANMIELQGRTITLWKESMPIWFNNGITKLYTTNTEKIVSRLSNDPVMLADIKKYDNELNETVEALTNMLIQSRGGTTATTRNIEFKSNGGSQ
jgi:hypothetical protein